jgi:hypothetical protein
MQSQVICVLGMHRSGTSCLTGTLEEAGVFLGDVVRQAKYNARGNRENLQIMTLHDQVLAANRGSWDDPPEQVRWSRDQLAAQREIIHLYAGYPRWGFKDPRTLFTLEAWLAALPGMTFVGIFRHPLAVAQSLQHRNQFPLGKGLDLWARYNRRLLHYQARFGFPIISFDSDEAALRRDFAGLLSRLGLPARGEDLKFFDQELRHQRPTHAIALPSEVTAILDELRRLAGQPSAAA